MVIINIQVYLDLAIAYTPNTELPRRIEKAEKPLLAHIMSRKKGNKTITLLNLYL